MVLMLIAGIYAMYETRGFWGLESNANVCTINNTLNTISAEGLLVVIPIVIVILCVVLFSLTRRAF